MFNLACSGATSPASKDNGSLFNAGDDPSGIGTVEFGLAFLVTRDGCCRAWLSFISLQEIVRTPARLFATFQKNYRCRRSRARIELESITLDRLTEVVPKHVTLNFSWIDESCLGEGYRSTDFVLSKILICKAQRQPGV